MKDLKTKFQLVIIEVSEEQKLAVGCAAFNAQFQAFSELEARASSSGWQVEAQTKLRVK
jgi:hypothetical protein